MSYSPAPLFEDIMDSPQGGAAYWLNAEDGVRIRLALWRNGTEGTVLLFPGRTEYVEKYGDAAAEFEKRGYSLAVLDWRGQGLSDRPHSDRALCHVGDFREFQLDVAAARAALPELGAPGPVYLLAHSMGGCVGLRSLHEGLPVRAAAFSGPMWRIYLGPLARRIALAFTGAKVLMGQGKSYLFGTNARNYLHIANPGKNALTSDAAMFKKLRHQIEVRPALATGGPSYGWLNAALRECRDLLKAEPPDYPVLTLLGTRERVVDPKAIRMLHSRWPGANLELVQESRHEVMMENSEIRNYFYGRVANFFSSF